MNLLCLPGQALSSEKLLDFLAGQAYTPGMRRKKNPHARALGLLGARKGGRARAAKLTPEQRQQIARKAAIARWAKKGRREGGSPG